MTRSLKPRPPDPQSRNLTTYTPQQKNTICLVQLTIESNNLHKDIIIYSALQVIFYKNGAIEINQLLLLNKCRKHPN